MGLDVESSEGNAGTELLGAAGIATLGIGVDPGISFGDFLAEGVFSTGVMLDLDFWSHPRRPTHTSKADRAKSPNFNIFALFSSDFVMGVLICNLLYSVEGQNINLFKLKIEKKSNIFATLSYIESVLHTNRQLNAGAFNLINVPLILRSIK